MVDYSHVIESKYGAVNREDFSVEFSPSISPAGRDADDNVVIPDNRDVEFTYKIVMWNLPDPQPTIGELEEWAQTPAYKNILFVSLIQRAKTEIDATVSQAIVKYKVSTDLTPILARYARNQELYAMWVQMAKPSDPDPVLFKYAYDESAVYAQFNHPYGTVTALLAAWGQQAHLMDAASSTPYFVARREALLRLSALTPDDPIEQAIDVILTDLKQAIF